MDVCLCVRVHVCVCVEFMRKSLFYILWKIEFN